MAFKEYSDGSFSYGGYKFDKGGNIISSPSDSSGSSSGGSSVKSGEGVYYDLEDPNKQYVREGEDFKQLDEPVTDPSTIENRTNRGGGRTGEVIKNNSALYDPNAQRQNTGVLTVTDKEAGQLQGTAVPYWKVQSETPSQAVLEGQYAGLTQQVNRQINTKELYEYNRYNIITGQKAYATYKATGELSEYDIKQIEEEARVEAKYDYTDLPVGQRAKLTVAGYGQGVSSTVIGGAEFSVNLLNQYNKGLLNEEGGSVVKDFKFKGTLGDIRRYPGPLTTGSTGNSVKQYITSPTSVGAGTVIIPSVVAGGKLLYGNIKTYGVAKGTVATAGEFMPFKLRGGIYTTKPEVTKITATKWTDAQGNINRVYQGSYGSGPFKSNIKGAEYFNPKTNIGKGITTVTAPYTKISGGGTIITQGTRVSSTPYEFGGSLSGTSYFARGNQFYSKVLLGNFKGGVTFVESGTTLTSYNTRTGPLIQTTKGGVRRVGGTFYDTTSKGVKTFTSGPGREVFTTIRQPNFKANVPTSRVRYNPNVVGTEYNLNQIYGGYSVTGTPTGSSGGGSVVTSQVTKNTISGLTIPTTTTITQKSGFTFTPVVQPGQTTKTNLQPISSNSQVVTQQAKEVQEGVGTVVIQQPNVRRGGSRQQGGLITLPQVTELPATNVRQRPNVITTPTDTTTPRLTQRNALVGYPGYSTISTPSTPTITTLTPPPFLLKLPMGPGRALKIGRIPAIKSQTGYTPSLRALFFKIRGPQTKGTPTGLRFRPITPSFRFSRKRKIKGLRIL